MLDELFVPDPKAGDSSNQIANTRFVTVAIATAIASVGLPSIAGLALLANSSTGTAVPGGVSLSNYLDVAAGSAQGEFLYRNAATWVVLPAGTSGQFLQTQGTALNPQWATQTRVLLNTLTPSAAGSATDTSSFTASYSLYEIVLENLAASSAAVTMRFRVHSGGAYKTTGYLASNHNDTSGGASGTDTQTTFIALSGSGALGTAAPGVAGTLRISNPSANAIHPCWGQMSHPQSATVNYLVTTGGYWNTAGAIDGFSIDASVGAITGTIRVYGIL